MSKPTLDHLFMAAEACLEDRPPDPNAVELATIARSLIGRVVSVEQARIIALHARADAWDEAYEQGIQDERTSADNIGIAGLGGKVGPCRRNPYRQEAEQ